MVNYLYIKRDNTYTFLLRGNPRRLEERVLGLTHERFGFTTFRAETKHTIHVSVSIYM